MISIRKKAAANMTLYEQARLTLEVRPNLAAAKAGVASMSSSRSFAGLSTCGICLSGGLNAPYLTRRKGASTGEGEKNVTRGGFSTTDSFGRVQFGEVCT